MTPLINYSGHTTAYLFTVSPPVPLRCSLIPAHHRSSLHLYSSVMWRTLYKWSHILVDPVHGVFSLCIMPLKLRLFKNINGSMLHLCFFTGTCLPDLCPSGYSGASIPFCVPHSAAQSSFHSCPVDSARASAQFQGPLTQPLTPSQTALHRGPHRELFFSHTPESGRNSITDRTSRESAGESPTLRTGA